MVKDHADEHLKGGRAGKTAAGEDVGGHIGIEAGKTKLLEFGSHATDEGGGFAHFLRVDGKVRQIDVAGGKAFA